jgi:hypothetical protein
LKIEFVDVIQNLPRLSIAEGQPIETPLLTGDPPESGKLNILHLELKPAVGGLCQGVSQAFFKLAVNRGLPQIKDTQHNNEDRPCRTDADLEAFVL